MAEKTVEIEVVYKCTNRYCFVYKVPQTLTLDMDTDCHNCNLPMKLGKNK